MITQVDQILSYCTTLFTYCIKDAKNNKLLSLADLQLNANKSKWSLFGHTGHCFNKVDFHVGGNLIEQVHDWPHLGHIISDECNDASDILNPLTAK